MLPKSLLHASLVFVTDRTAFHLFLLLSLLCNTHLAALRHVM